MGRERYVSLQGSDLVFMLPQMNVCELFLYIGNESTNEGSLPFSVLALQPFRNVLF